MAAEYPTAIKSFIAKSDGFDIYLASHINDLQNEVAAIEAELGTLPKGSAADVKTRIANLETLKTKYIYLPAKFLDPTDTAGCATLAFLEAATNKQKTPYLAFDPATIEYSEAAFAMPPNWNGGTITITFYWMHPATTTNFTVIWAAKGRAYANDDAMDQAYGTAVEVTDIGGTTYDHYISAVSSALTLAGSPAGGQDIQLRIYRKANDAADNLAVDAYLLGAMIAYTVN